MKLKAITIRRTESYSTPANTMVGTVDFIDEQGGACTIVLSPRAIIKFADLVRMEVQDYAQRMVKDIPAALRNAQDELELQSTPMLTADDL